MRSIFSSVAWPIESTAYRGPAKIQGRVVGISEAPRGVKGRSWFHIGVW